MDKGERIIVSAPGRICLFGEHQDYLGLPVIPMAINLRIQIEATKRSDNIFSIELPDIMASEEIVYTQSQFVYSKKRDYFKSIFNVLMKRGYNWEHGWNCVIRGNIPINSGTSSSSALNNVWCKFLVEASQEGNKNISNQEIGMISYEAEVLEFNEAGGMMDQLSTAIGSINFMDFTQPITISRLSAQPGAFVLGDTQEPKDTEKILSETKAPAIKAMTTIQTLNSSVYFRNISINELYNYRDLLSEHELQVMKGVIYNREITSKALKLLQAQSINHTELGNLLNQHQLYLRENLGISTPKIDNMIQASLQSGALGAKINGSGGGGCMFAYAPENPEEVAKSIVKAGGEAYIIRIDEGLLTL